MRRVLCRILSAGPAAGLAVAAGLLLAPVLPAPQQAGADHEVGAEASFARGRSLLAAGRMDEARAAALEGLGWRPYSREGYALLFDLAGKAGDAQAALRWGKWLYWSDFYSGRAKEAKRTAARLEEVYPGWDRDGEILAAWHRSVEKAIRSAAGSSKRYRLAGHLYSRLLDLNPFDQEIRKGYDRLAKRAGSSVSAGVFVVDRVRRLPPRWLERQNRKHAPWENAFHRRTHNYDIYTNISYEFAETAPIVMEEMNRFYREIYSFRKKVAPLILAIHRTRVDFDKYCHEVLGGSGGLGLGGWFTWSRGDRKLTVAAYDRTEQGHELAGLWNTLFHEASHHFSYLLADGHQERLPIWVNEGTASYFEGCELKPDGSITKNKPATGRVREWLFFDGSSRARHSLKDLITVPHRRYDVSYYSYGWSLVYFLLNYEEGDWRAREKAGEETETSVPDILRPGRLVYRDAYRQYYQTFASGKGGDPFGEAQRLFVDEIGDPEVSTWEQFEARWRRFTKGVAREVNSGPEAARVLQARVRGYLEAGDVDRALIAAELADDKRPEDRVTYRLLAVAHDQAGNHAEAVYWMVRAWELAWLAGKEADEDAAAALAWLEEHEAKDVVEDYCRATMRAADGIAAAMDRAEADGQPAAAMLYASHLMRALGRDHKTLLDREAGLREESGQDLRLWIRVFAHKSPDENRMIGMTDAVRFDRDGVLINCPESSGWVTQRSDLPAIERLEPPFELRGTVQVDGKTGALLFLGIGTGGRPSSALIFRNGAEIEFASVDFEVDEESSSGFGRTRLNGTSTLPLPPLQKIAFHLVLRDTGGEVRVGESKKSLPGEWDRDRFAGGFSIGARSDCVALFSDLEVRSARPFWPVPPPADDED